MITDTAERILAYIKQKNEATPKEIVQFIGFGAPAVFRQIKKLLEKGLIKKVGKAPRVFYVQAEPEHLPPIKLSKETDKIVNSEYAIFTPLGKMLCGTEGFAYWCEKHNLPLEKTATEFVSIIKKYNSFKDGGLIEATDKFAKTFSDHAPDRVFYLDFYSRERFGKTKLGLLVLYAKQSQSLRLIQEIYHLIDEKIRKIIVDNNIDAVGFIPPTISRKVQLMKELERMFNFSLPRLNIVKAVVDIPIPQKSLASIGDRIQNANETIFVNDERRFNNILLIDDAVGSGATLDQTAKKIRAKNLCAGKIICLAIVGSFNGFDVIQEV